MISQAALVARARLLQDIRRFFDARGVMEVVTPALGRTAVPDLHIDSLAVDTAEGVRFLQTSPEYFMKRLLAEHATPIYQIGPVFRAGERGRQHNTEFQMLEWYRPGMSLDDLAAETVELVNAVRRSASRGHAGVRTTSYSALFESRFGLNPHEASLDELRETARAAFEEACAHIADIGDEATRNDYLDVLFSCGIEASLGGTTVVTDFPASQAALARIVEVDGFSVAARFELYIDGMEIANAYDELCDAAELRSRFIEQNEMRLRRGKAAVDIDEALLDAVSQMPPCTGIALGVDRLLRSLVDARGLADIMAFTDERL